MRVIDECLHGVKLLEPVVHWDSRGFFLESFNQAAFDQLRIPFHPVQDNHSMSSHEGTVRGLHFQLPPYGQAKLVRVLAGAVYDVMVDIRPDSPTFGQRSGYHLTASNRRMLFIPNGFAHGFCTLSDDTEVEYKVDSPYAPDHSAGILWSDPQLDIDWPDGSKTLSEADKRHPTLQEWMESGQPMAVPQTKFLLN